LLIHLLYTSFRVPLTEKVYLSYLNALPERLKEKNTGYIRWEDKHAHLFGKLLLLKGLQMLNYDSGVLEQIVYKKYDRPFLNSHIDFNISHSGQYVVCALATDMHLGIDIEEIKEINFDDFKEVMTDKQWKDITNAEDSSKEFFKYWTIKESVIKADSRGMSIPLTEIHVNASMAYCESKLWNIQEIKLDRNYCCYLASDKKNMKINIRQIDFAGDNASTDI